MKQSGLILAFLLSAIVFAPMSLAVDEYIIDVYTSNLTYYDESGIKQGRFTGVKVNEIRGVEVLGTSTRSLKLIDFRDKKVWIRASQVKLSLSTTPVCPDSAPGRASDRTTPVSSGMGADCIKGGEK